MRRGKIALRQTPIRLCRCARDRAPACSFRTAGGAPGAKVSWEVKAVRNDLWVRTNGAPVEIEKRGPETGTYQHPDVYGPPPERGTHSSPTQRALGG